MRSSCSWPLLGYRSKSDDYLVIILRSIHLAECGSDNNLCRYSIISCIMEWLVLCGQLDTLRTARFCMAVPQIIAIPNASFHWESWTSCKYGEFLTIMFSLGMGTLVLAILGQTVAKHCWTILFWVNCSTCRWHVFNEPCMYKAYHHGW